jgi:hypothetical protein
LSLAKVIELEPPEPTEKRCGTCGEDRPLNRFRKSQLDDPDAECASCRAPRQIPDPDVPLPKVVASALTIPLPEDWAEDMASGRNFKVEVVLQVDHAVGTDSGPMHWSARWLEVTRLDD